ncbi:MAG: hypothetical protein PVF56_17975, partial [Desulfobacterales bacterium]
YLDAISYAEKGVACIEKLSESDANQKKLIDARSLLAGYHMSINHHVEAKEAVVPIVELAEKINYHKRLPTIYIALGSYSLLIDEDLSKGVQFLNEALKISKKTKDYFSMWAAFWFTALGLYYENEIKKSIGYLNKGIALSEAGNHQGPAIFLKSYIVTWFYPWQGKIDPAEQVSLECLRVAEESGDIYYKTPAYISYGVLSYVKGDFDTAESYLLQALAFSEKTGHYTNWMTAGQFIFELYISMGEYKEARKYFEKMISILEPTKYRLSEIGLYKVGLARTKISNPDHNVDIDEVLKFYSDIRSTAMQHRCARYVCDIFLNTDLQKDKAEYWIKNVIETDNKNSFIFYLGQDYARYAEFYKKRGDLSKARENLNKAIEIMREFGADGWVHKYEKQLTVLS